MTLYVELTRFWVKKLFCHFQEQKKGTCNRCEVGLYVPRVAQKNRVTSKEAVLQYHNLQIHQLPDSVNRPRVCPQTLELLISSVLTSDTWKKLSQNTNSSLVQHKVQAGCCSSVETGVWEQFSSTTEQIYLRDRSSAS